MGGGSAERIHTAVDRLAAALFAGAAGYAFLEFQHASYPEPQLGVFSAVVAVVSFLLCLRILRGVGSDGQGFVVALFELAPIENAELGELVLTDSTALLLTEQVELVLTDADRLRTAKSLGPDELVLDDILAELGPDSRVVRLFDPAAMPTPGQLSARIERHLGDESPQPEPADASQALYDALAELRRSLG